MQYPQRPSFTKSKNAGLAGVRSYLAPSISSRRVPGATLFNIRTALMMDQEVQEVVYPAGSPEPATSRPVQVQVELEQRARA
jgi:hypothetical protein